MPLLVLKLGTNGYSQTIFIFSYSVLQFVHRIEHTQNYLQNEAIQPKSISAVLSERSCQNNRLNPISVKHEAILLPEVPG